MDAIPVIFVIACVILSNYCFVLLEILKTSKPLEWYNYIYIVLYELIVIMVLWCLFRLVVSDPGYIPQDYRYDVETLDALDKALYRAVEESSSEHTFTGPNFETKSTMRETSMFGW